MRIERVLPGASAAQAEAAPAKGPAKGATFAQRLAEALQQVSDLQREADTLAARMVSGDLENVHQAIIAQEKALLALELTVQVRNKAIEAYQELMRTQV